MGEIPGAVSQKMKFTKVKTYEMSGGIPLDGFRINKDKGPMPSVEFALKELAELRGTDKRFVYKILDKEGKLKKPGKYISQGFDPFDKLSFLHDVRITRYPCVPGHEDAYLLELEDGEGRKLESKLAKRLGSKQALSRKVLNVDFEAEGDDGKRFRVDCDDVSSRLQGMYQELQPEDTESLCIKERFEGPQPKAPLTGRTILYTFLHEHFPLSGSKEPILGVADGVVQVSHIPLCWATSNTDEWEIFGNVITGPNESGRNPRLGIVAERLRDKKGVVYSATTPRMVSAIEKVIFNAAKGFDNSKFK